TWGGFGLALIRKQNASHIDENSVFYFNVFIGVIACGILWIAAPFIASFYQKSILVPLTRVLSLGLIINALGMIHTTKLIKLIDFKTQTKVSIIAAFSSGCIGIFMSYRGFGVWSLVAQSLGSDIFRTVLLWKVHSWRPVLKISFDSLKNMFAFGSRMLISDLLETIFNNVDLMVIGKVFTPADLGYYSKAVAFKKLPVDNVCTTIWRVAYPVFASMQENTVRIKHGTRMALMSAATIVFPMMIGLAIVSKPLIIILLTEKWLPCVQYLQMLCVVGLLYPMHIINSNVLTTLGRSDLFLHCSIFEKCVSTAALLICYRWGIVSIIFGQIVTSVVSLFLKCHYTKKLIVYSLYDQTKDLLPIMFLSILMGLGIIFIKYLTMFDITSLLIVQISSGIFVFYILCYIFKLSAFMEIDLIIRPKVVTFLKTFFEKG
ncbi:MAG: lipopolysaccharide biosynthesis protein, partial [Bacteroidales bacterium]|nr:lipopolysaccharide biosynthesis protein [Bacteroidales bacterium]